MGGAAVGNHPAVAVFGYFAVEDERSAGCLVQDIRLVNFKAKVRLDGAFDTQNAQHPVEILPQFGAFGRDAEDLTVETITR